MGRSPELKRETVLDWLLNCPLDEAAVAVPDDEGEVVMLLRGGDQWCNRWLSVVWRSLQFPMGASDVEPSMRMRES